ncbi:hypothetical protein [Agromyces seonyuensis]|uniref:Uncharacterized protein n=1 Tax=Agromyces seonyuensis TaxID=2662446 RepID=A0A6I4NX34_9MICO|nr:hypothetical protein [Agromyces seonyuensis]MWB98860.1 hypothetical protein [Agromyces seonyuensis]
MTASGSEPAPERSELEQATAWLEQITGDPLAGAVRGVLELVDVPEPVGRGRFRPVELGGIASAEGVPPTPVRLSVVLDRRHWPAAGARLPARIPPARPADLEVDWDALRR